MGKEIVWEPDTQTFAIFDTVVCDYIATKIPSPEAVADFIVEDNEYYFTEPDGKGQRHIVVAEWTTRQQLIDYWQAIMRSPPIRSRTMVNGIWVENQVDETQRQRHLKAAMEYALAAWDSGRSRPDPKAKAELRAYWIREANDIRGEGKTGVPLFGCDINTEKFFTGEMKYVRPPKEPST